MFSAIKKNNYLLTFPFPMASYALFVKKHWNKSETFKQNQKRISAMWRSQKGGSKSRSKKSKSKKSKSRSRRSKKRHSKKK